MRLAGEAQKVHQDAANQKLSRITTLQEFTDTFLSQIGLPTTKTTTDKWPNISERFKILWLEIEYRTVYAALCSQTHNDAEDLLNYIYATSSDNQDLIDKVATHTEEFSRFMLYFAVKYYLTVAYCYAIRFELFYAEESITIGRNAIIDLLEEIAKELSKIDMEIILLCTSIN
jgi:hypothetical protein